LFNVLRRKNHAHVAGPLKPETNAELMLIYTYPEETRQVLEELRADSAPMRACTEYRRWTARPCARCGPPARLVEHSVNRSLRAQTSGWKESTPGPESTQPKGVLFTLRGVNTRYLVLFGNVPGTGGHRFFTG
jgi:hypothetical protein